MVVLIACGWLQLVLLWSKWVLLGACFSDKTLIWNVAKYLLRYFSEARQFVVGWFFEWFYGMTVFFLADSCRSVKLKKWIDPRHQNILLMRIDKHLTSAWQAPDKHPPAWPVNDAWVVQVKFLQFFLHPRIQQEMLLSHCWLGLLCGNGEVQLSWNSASGQSSLTVKHLLRVAVFLL